MRTTFLLLILVAVLAVATSTLGKSYYTRRPTGRNATKWILGTYWAVLFVSIMILCFIPDKGFLYPEKELPKSSVNQRLSRGYMADADILRAARENRLEQTDGILLLEKRDFVFPGTELEVSLQEDDANILIIAQRKEENDGRMEAAYYITKILCNGIDVSDRIKLPRMELSGNRLQVINPETEIEIAEFRKDFTVAQFLDVDADHQKDGWSLTPRRKVLYLQVPPNVQIKAAKLDVEYIEEE